MAADRIHRTVSADGTEIAGRVHGKGPPLVLFHGSPHDADLAWEALVPHLADRFTCYLPNERGKGLSGDSEDHTPPRLEEDALAFVDSIGQSVNVAGWSYGVFATLAAAANRDTVTAVALYEPTIIIPVMRQDDLADMFAMLEPLEAAVADRRLADAARVFHPCFANDDELAALDTDYYERSGTAFPPMMRTVAAAQTYDGARATDPEAMAQIAVPVLLLRGQRTRRATFYTDTQTYIAEHVADPHARELPGLGHFAPTVAPEPVADALVSFFESVHEPT